MQLAVADHALVAGLADPDVGGLVAAAGREVLVEAVDRRVQLAVGEPLEERRVGVVERLRRLAVPGQAGERARHPEADGIGLGLGVQRLVRDPCALAERRGRRERPAAPRAGPRWPASVPPCALLRSDPSARRLTIAKRRRAVGPRDAARGAGILRRCLVSGRFVRGRSACWRSRSPVSPRSPSASTAGSAAAPRTSGSAYAVLINVPGAQSSGTPTRRRGSYTYRDLVAVAVLRGRLGAQRRARLRAQRPHRRQPAGRLRDGRVRCSRARSPTAARIRRTGTFGGTRHGSRRRGRGGLGAARRPVRDPRHRLRRGQRAARSCARTAPIAAPRSRSTSTSRADWHNLPAGTEILLGYAGGRRDRARDGRAGCRRARPPTPAATAPGDARRRVELRPGAARRPGRAPAGERRHADGLGRRHHADRHRGAAAGRLHAHARRSIRRARRSCVAPGYVFPVAGGAHYGHDFGNFRARHGLPPGQRPLRARGHAARRGRRPASSTTSAGTASAAGACGSRTSNGNWFYYAHLSAFSPIAIDGAHVNAGDVVGFVGHTGDARGHALAPALRDPPGGQVVGSAL